jgi:hypothetical protein
MARLLCNEHTEKRQAELTTDLMQSNETSHIAVVIVFTHSSKSRCCADSSVPTYMQRPLIVDFNDKRGDEDRHFSPSNFLEACTVHVSRRCELSQAYLAMQHELTAANEIPHHKHLETLGSKDNLKRFKCCFQLS